MAYESLPKNYENEHVHKEMRFNSPFLKDKERTSPTRGIFIDRPQEEEEEKEEVTYKLPFSSTPTPIPTPPPTPSPTYPYSHSSRGFRRGSVLSQFFFIDFLSYFFVLAGGICLVYLIGKHLLKTTLKSALGQGTGGEGGGGGGGGGGGEEELLNLLPSSSV
jgi:hypothetical protein